MLPHTWKFPADVPGWLTEAEGRALAELATDKMVLEIGSYCGRSTICMAQTAHVIHAVDWGHGDEGSGFDWTTPRLIHNLHGFFGADGRGLGGKTILHVGRSDHVVNCFHHGIFDLVFIDAAHDSASVAADLSLAKFVLVPGGIVAMHDWNYPSVREAAEAVLGKAEGRMVDALAIIEGIK